MTPKNIQNGGKHIQAKHTQTYTKPSVTAKEIVNLNTAWTRQNNTAKLCRIRLANTVQKCKKNTQIKSNKILITWTLPVKMTPKNRSKGVWWLTTQFSNINKDETPQTLLKDHHKPLPNSNTHSSNTSSKTSQEKCRLDLELPRGWNASSNKLDTIFRMIQNIQSKWIIHRRL